MRNSYYRLRKSRHILKHCFSLYKKKAKILPKDLLQRLEKQMDMLDQAILRKNRQEASDIAKQLEAFCSEHMKKSLWDYTKEITVAVILALAIATVIRQTWFELYEIPSGSMRPTLREQDHLAVTKTAFGINVPLQAKHFYFDPSLVQRTGIVIFSGHDIALGDTSAKYFGFIPYKKQYIKRLIGKPGDSLYFYGGKIWGVDQNNRFLTELQQAPWMQTLEHIPFLSFEGRSFDPKTESIFFSLMGHPIGRLAMHPFGKPKGQIFKEGKWVEEDLQGQEKGHPEFLALCDFYGIRGFAMTRLLTKQQMESMGSDQVSELPEAAMYLELHHHPNLSFPHPKVYIGQRQHAIVLSTMTSVIPLQKLHLEKLMRHMTTSRFVVSKGRARSYSTQNFGPRSPSLPNVPDGTYEFIDGEAYQIGFGGIASKLPSNHPLYDRSPKGIQRLYNIGILFDTATEPREKDQHPLPHRYAYFREGDLFLMGNPVIKKDDPVLIDFVKREHQRQRRASSTSPYLAFEDPGPPVKNGTIDSSFVRTFGITVPPGHYLVLGDNHAISADSRVFGFVPEENLQGVPSMIIWPPGTRWGLLTQNPYPLICGPRFFIWTVGALALACWMVFLLSRRNKPIFKKINISIDKKSS